MSIEQVAALLTDHDVARKLGVSRSFVHKMRSQGKLPEPVRLGRCLRWRADEIAAWIAAGCPTRDTWIWEAATDA